MWNKNTRQAKKRKKIRGTGEKLPRLAFDEDDEESKGELDASLQEASKHQMSLQKVSSHVD